MSRDDWRYLWFLLRDIAGRERRTIACVVIMSLAGAVSPYVWIVGTGVLLDGIYAGRGVRELIGCVLVIVCLTFVLTVIRSRAEESFQQKLDYTKDLECREMNRKSLSMDYEYLEDTHVQELRTRSLAKSYYGIRGWFLVCMHGLLELSGSVVMGLGILGFRFAESGAGKMPADMLLLAFLLILILGVLIFWDCRVGMLFTRRSREGYNLLEGLFNKKRYFCEMLAGVESQKDLRINRQQKEIDNNIGELCKALQKGELRNNSFFIRRCMTRTLVSGISDFLTYAFMGLCAYRGIISIGNVIVYASGISRILFCFVSVFSLSGNLKQTSYYARDYMQFMTLEKRKHEGTIPMEKRRDNRFQVDFEHVSFRYPGTDQDVIHDLNLSFEIGEKMAIVGKNGSGKTTFIKLLCRLYDVTEGCIKVNGIDIRKYDYGEYSDLFAVVFQDFCMFAFPLGENIAGSAEVDRQRAEEALCRVGLGERLSGLADGLDTCIGKEYRENGVAFSGGEKQKMAIARAIYKDAPFVIMDEPTAALDPEAECEVYAGFDQMVGNKTALYISHRLASCRFCRDILVFDGGRVVQRGSHGELEKQDGIYRELWEAQAQYYI